MSKLYKKVTLLVSRAYYHGGDGLENLGLRFFRSKKEYDQEAEKHGWQNRKSFKSSWCTRPVEIEGWVQPEDFDRFQSGSQPLNVDKVLFPASLVTKIYQVGGLQG